MESRWALLGFGLLFGLLLLVNIQQGNAVLGLIAVVFTIFGLGGFGGTRRKTTLSKRDFHDLGSVGSVEILLVRHSSH